MDYTQLGQMVQAKYPQYGNMAPDQVGQLVVQKYPQYQSLVASNGSQAMAMSQPEGAQLHDTGSFLGNVANSAGNFLSGIGQAIAHPINTVENLGRGIFGAGEYLGSAITGGPKPTDQNAQVAASIGNFFKQRYGSLDAAATTLKQDPVGFLADASVLFGGAEGALKGIGALSDVSKLGEAENLLSKGAAFSSIPGGAGIVADYGGGLSKAGEIAGKVGEFTNPVSLAAKGASVLLKPVSSFLGSVVDTSLGSTTGAGTTSIGLARNGGSDFMNAARGNTTADQIISDAQNAFDTIKENRTNAYQTQLKTIKATEGSLDYSPVLNNFKTNLSDNGIVVTKDGLNFDNARGFQSPSQQALLQTVYDKLNNWGKTSGNRTLYGLDTLKQQLSDFYNQANGRTGALIADTKSALSDILNQNSDYKALTEPYEATSNLIRNLQANFSLAKDNPETILKKLTTAMRQDNQYKNALMDELGNITGHDLQAQIAGLQLQNWSPRGVGKMGAAIEVPLAFLHPHILPLLAASSPRLVAEFMHAMGMATTGIDKGLAFLKAYKAAQVATGLQRVNASAKTQSSSASPKSGYVVRSPYRTTTKSSPIAKVRPLPTLAGTQMPR